MRELLASLAQGLAVDPQAGHVPSCGLAAELLASITPHLVVELLASITPHLVVELLASITPHLVVELPASVTPRPGHPGRCRAAGGGQ